MDHKNPNQEKPTNYKEGINHDIALRAASEGIPDDIIKLIQQSDGHEFLEQRSQERAQKQHQKQQALARCVPDEEVINAAQWQPATEEDREAIKHHFETLAQAGYTFLPPGHHGYSEQELAELLHDFKHGK